MKTLTVISPRTDNSLSFNRDAEKYELTIEYVKANFEITYKDDGVLLQRIKKNSRKIYNYIYSHAYTYNVDVVKFALNHTEEGRKFILDVLVEELEADLSSGINDLSSTPAININNGQVIDRNELIKNQISVDAEQIIDNNGAYFGFNILYKAPFPYGLFCFAQKR